MRHFAFGILSLTGISVLCMAGPAGLDATVLAVPADAHAGLAGDEKGSGEAMPRRGLGDPSAIVGETRIIGVGGCDHSTIQFRHEDLLRGAGSPFSRYDGVSSGDGGSSRREILRI